MARSCLRDSVAGCRSRAAALALLALAGSLFSGCLAGGEGSGPAPDLRLRFAGPDVSFELSEVQSLQREGLELSSNVTIHVVFVGTPEGLYDEERLRASLPPFFSPSIPFDSPPFEDGWRSPLFYRFAYEFHRAPDAFGRDLFAYADSIGEEVPASDFLRRYDALYEERLSDGESTVLFDAPSVEGWIADHRGEHGLAFADPENTIFVLDSYSSGWWPHETYYHYAYDDVIGAEESARNLRVWGGLQDFLFIDVSAAPNDDTNDRSAPVETFPVNWLNPAPAPEGTAYNDPPVWHYGPEGTATVGRGPLAKTVEADVALASDLSSAVTLRLFPTYLYPPIYRPVYQLDLHVFHDGTSLVPKDADYASAVEELLDGVRRQVPWAEVRGDLSAHLLPAGDPGMHAALTRARAHGAGAYLPAAPLMDEVDAHPERYADADDGAFHVKALFFLLSGHETVYLPLLAAGVALGDVEGQAWGTISNVNDLQYARGTDPVDAFLAVNLHEIGHFFGLRHPHDGDTVNANGEYSSIDTDYTWGSVASALSYRIRAKTSDEFDRASIARAHTLANLRTALRDAETAYRLLADDGIVYTPPSVLHPLRASEAAANDALALFERGRWIDSVHAALDAAASARKAQETAGGAPLVEAPVAAWETKGVTTRGAKAYALGSTATANAEPFFDYREVTLPPEVEAVRIRVTFTNTPTSWGDLFAGWSPPIRMFDLLEVPGADSVRIAPFGVHDHVEEGPTTGQAVIEHLVTIDKFPVLRELGSLYVGAGALGPAQDASYRVEVSALYRQWDGEAGPGELVGAAEPPFSSDAPREGDDAQRAGPVPPVPVRGLPV